MNNSDLNTFMVNFEFWAYFWRDTAPGCKNKDLNRDFWNDFSIEVNYQADFIVNNLQISSFAIILKVKFHSKLFFKTLAKTLSNFC